jgi:hypothetical protein
MELSSWVLLNAQGERPLSRQYPLVTTLENTATYSIWSVCPHNEVRVREPRWSFQTDCTAIGSRWHVCVLVLNSIGPFSARPPPPFHMGSGLPSGNDAWEDLSLPLGPALRLNYIQDPKTPSSSTEIPEQATPSAWSWGGKCPSITSRMITLLLTYFPPSCISTNTFWKEHFFKHFSAANPLPHFPSVLVYQFGLVITSWKYRYYMDVNGICFLAACTNEELKWRSSWFSLTHSGILTEQPLSSVTLLRKP